MLRYAGDLVSGVLQLDLIEAAIRKALAPFGIDFHPAPYWHHAFVLLWLLNGSMARNLSGGVGWGDFLFMIIWGGLTALVAGAATGTVPLNTVAMMWWPFAGFAAFMAGLVAWVAVHDRSYSWQLLVFPAGAASFAYLGFVSNQPLTSAFGPAVPSPGLLILAGFVGVMGLISFLVGLFVIAHFDDTIDNDLTSMGLDIVGAFGLAAALAIAGQYLL
jgi:hypothetical protein